MAEERPTTEVGAANLALALIKEPPIAGFDEPRRVAARAARKWFGVTRDELLREQWWNFATDWDRPAADAAESIGPLKKRYPMPPDCIEIRSIEGASEDQWAVENAVIDLAGTQAERVVLVTNLTAPLCCYTKRVTNVALWDPQFIVAFAARLGSYVGPEIGRSPQTVRAVEDKAEKKLDRAASSDAREKAPAQIRKDVPALRARFVGRHRG
jgi:hypothetical protein